MKEARFYNIEDGKIRCNLCPHRCLIKDGHFGICGARKSSSVCGELKLYTINYGEITSISMDRIEKKPLYEFYKGSEILSIGSFGCNFKCSFCQNYSISQYMPKSKKMTVEEVSELVCSTFDNLGVAFTYNEPSIFYEFVYDVSKRIKELNKDKKIVLVTNGYINKEPFKKLAPFIDAMNIDLKGDNDYYNKLCKGRIEPVKDIIRVASKSGIHVEITTLLVTGENTNNSFIEELGNFIESIDVNIPLHLSRYFPNYKMTKEMTSLEEMKDAYRLLRGKVKNIYLGNVTEEEEKYIKEI
ncbi:radical SAM protein [Clostridium sardiniense]|uniref:Radical SAM protein n=1 Tax=Clostridium sardiniense TaxID=29369 RepID=A0ABS7KWM8_CLOSR|nr:radical SAM protein [Clostridium sardiniense]MBY0755082.1 radical SAM protein [Clostridium sardiniense]MDQ0459060.1 pyruvate formate lyase activating enzyme [Clostridium sardiniense]